MYVYSNGITLQTIEEKKMGNSKEMKNKSNNKSNKNDSIGRSKSLEKTSISFNIQFWLGSNCVQVNVALK